MSELDEQSIRELNKIRNLLLAFRICGGCRGCPWLDRDYRPMRKLESGPYAGVYVQITCPCIQCTKGVAIENPIYHSITCCDERGAMGFAAAKIGIQKTIDKYNLKFTFTDVIYEYDNIYLLL